MLFAYRRHGLVVALILAAGLLTVAARPNTHLGAYLGAVPSATPLLVGTGWHVLNEQPGDTHYARTGLLPYDTATVSNGQGFEAQLFLSPANTQKALHWTGELGYEGAGYQTTHREVIQIPLSQGRTAPASLVIDQRMSDRELLEYATISPDAIVAHSANDLLWAGWDMLRGRTGPYYVVRVSVYSPTPGFDKAARSVATRLLSPLLVRLYAQVRAAAQ